MTSNEIIAASKWSTGKDGQEYPSRFVVVARKDNNGTIIEYARYMQVNDGKNEEYFVFGHYYSNFKDAVEDMKKSINDNNRNYSVISMSHMPGIDFVSDNEFPIGSKYGWVCIR